MSKEETSPTVEICKMIEKIYGHRVEPSKLAELIETSPLP